MKIKSNYSVKIYTSEKEKINQIKKILDKRLSAMSFFRLPLKRSSYTIRCSPCGRGFSTFKKVQAKIHKAIISFSNLLDLKKAIPLINEHKVFTDVKIR